jgi:hypothetical protein
MQLLCYLRKNSIMWLAEQKSHVGDQISIGNIVIIHVQSAPKTTSPMPQSSKN